MNIQQTIFINTCIIEVHENAFTEDQKIDLFELLAKASRCSVFMWPIRIKNFENAFIKYGGNHARLYEKLTKSREQQAIVVLKSLKPGIKIYKNGELK